MRINSIIKMFENDNVCVTGLRGTGKDMLFGNVIARRKKPYVSNIDYKCKYSKFHYLVFDKIDCGKNDYRNFISGNVNFYQYPYPMGSDIYISDAGIYLPSQFCSELNRDYKYLPTYCAISRHVSRNNVHFNVQNLNRVYDKFREMSCTYIRCRRCIYFHGLVIQFITIYDKYQSCLDRVEPCRVTRPLLGSSEAKTNTDLYIDKYYNTYGSIKNHILIYFNKSQYDTHFFEKLLKGGKK